MTVTSKEILHAIVEREQQARQSYDAACEKVRGYDDYIARKREELRQAAFAEADEKLAALEAEETAAASAKISEMELKQEQDYAGANRWYQDNREEFISRVFDMVVNSDV